MDEIAKSDPSDDDDGVPKISSAIPKLLGGAQVKPLNSQKTEEGIKAATSAVRVNSRT
ncbi:hypothetical protein V7S43_001193 [Phytophthora oleae]|uniref:Uncharacterized protein n=1 Tax=Phytophthora oleae TaxID=2107226 RepID=A0ABD3G2Y1_9STRA